ncbi:MAG TPA: hypothetical protein VG015_03665, partial [Candidatus Dormibacteraeota bacterium]|nr:hypothetical protein [Candidatus Dormibacteraeota bacterium]
MLSPDEPDQALVDDTSKQDVDSTVTVGAAPKAPRWPGRRTRLIAAGVAGLLLLGGSGGVWARQSETHLLTQLTADFQAGQAQLEAGKALLKTANSQHEVADIDRADADFKAAGKEFQAAKSVVTQNSLVSVGEHLPGISGYLDPRVSAAINLCDMGSSLAAAAIDAGEVDRLLIQPDPNGAKGGAKLVQVLASAQPLVTKAHNDLTAASTSLARVNRSVLPAAQAHLLGTAQDTITKGLA